MFFDTIQSQANSQNTNLSNNITLGSTGTDLGNFAPINETKPEFKNTNDLGLSASMYGNAGAVGMSKQEQTDRGGSTYDGYMPPKKDDNNLLFGVGIFLTFALSLYSFFKLKKVK